MPRSAERGIGESHFKFERRAVYVACEEMDFVWDTKDVEQVDHMWPEGMALGDIARAFERDPDEVAILVIDRARRGKMQPRTAGAYGGKVRCSFSV